MKNHLIYFTTFLMVSTFYGCGGGGGEEPASKTDGQITDKISGKKPDEIVRIKTIAHVPKEGLSINEFLASNGKVNLDADYKQFSDWLELYNNSDNDMDIGGYYLSDDEENPKKWKIPKKTTIKAGKYLLIWADENNKKLHTNFKISSSQGTLILSDKDAHLVDKLTYKKQERDISCAKINDKIYYLEPTPASKNKTAYDKPLKTKKPKFSIESGFYDGTQTIELTQENGGEIYYTTDGSIPTIKSQKYTQAISIDKTTIIRARALAKNRFLSGVKNKTYFIDEKTTLPVVSIGIDDKYLWDDKIGIYTLGTDENGNPHPLSTDTPPDWESANYFHKWQRPASIEYFKDKKSKFSENIGVRIAGAGSRNRPQKSIAIFAKNKYGPKSIKYALFSDKPKITKVKSFTLRNSGGDRVLLMKDALTQAMIRDNMDVDYQSYHPSVLFVNGEYWGIFNVREKLNEAYVKANHGVSKKELDMIGSDEELLNGSYDDYEKILNFVKTHDMSNNENYNKIIKQIDLDEYLNYYITEIFVGNWDWPSHNIRYWKKSKDGKWRWMLSDTDDGYGTMKPFTDNTFVQILDKNAFAEGYGGTRPSSTLLFRKLMLNRTFKNLFISKFTTHLNLTFKQSRIDRIIQELKQPLIPEVKRHYDRWRDKEPSRLAGYKFSDWSANVDRLTHIQGTTRAKVLRGYMKSYLDARDSNQLKISLASNGTVTVDDVKLTKKYDGKYFNDAKVTLKAIPQQGHEFIQWSNGQTNSKITITLTNDVSIHAIFQ